MVTQKKLYLYDPRTNVQSPYTYKEIAEFTGLSERVLQSKKSKGQKLKAINCYIVDECITVAQRKAWYEKEKYPDEAWLTIKGSDGRFLISNYGRVKRIYKNHENFLLPFQIKGRGNLFIKVTFKGKYGEHKVGHLVAAHFIREANPGEFVVRKNGIITDDYAGNLTICTKEELGKMTGHKSKSKEVVQIDLSTGEIINEFRSAREAGRKCNYSYQAILDRCHEKYPFKGEVVTFRFAEDYEAM